jgi:hypothetical protein
MSFTAEGGADQSTLADGRAFIWTPTQARKLFGVDFARLQSEGRREALVTELTARLQELPLEVLSRSGRRRGLDLYRQGGVV